MGNRSADMIEEMYKEIEREKPLRSELNILKQVHAKMVNDYADFKMLHYNKMSELRLKISKIKMDNLELQRRLEELEVYEWKYKGLCK